MNKSTWLLILAIILIFYFWMVTGEDDYTEGHDLMYPNGEMVSPEDHEQRMEALLNQQRRS